MVVRILALLLVILAVVVFNFFHPSSQTRARSFDLLYIAENCVGLTDQQAENIDNYIEPLGAFVGTDYLLFDLSDDGTPENHRRIALRDDIQEALCFPAVGCLIPPVLKGECLAK